MTTTLFTIVIRSLDDLAEVWPQLGMPLFTIYADPTDFPDKYVVRLFDGATAQPTPYVSVHESLAEARKFVPPEMTRLNRSPSDDRKIVESYV